MPLARAGFGRRAQTRPASPLLPGGIKSRCGGGPSSVVQGSGNWVVESPWLAQALRRCHHFFRSSPRCDCGGLLKTRSAGRLKDWTRGWSGLAAILGVHRTRRTFPGVGEGSSTKDGLPKARAASRGLPAWISAAPRRKRLTTTSAVSSSKAIHRTMGRDTRGKTRAGRLFYPRPEAKGKTGRPYQDRPWLWSAGRFPGPLPGDRTRTVTWAATASVLG